MHFGKPRRHPLGARRVFKAPPWQAPRSGTISLPPRAEGFPPLPPFRQCAHDASQRLAVLTQRIFDPRRHPGKDRSRDDALTFKITQLHREHVLTDSGDRSSEFVEAAWTSQQLPQDQQFPLSPKNRQCRVDLWRRHTERGGIATGRGVGHLFHTTPQNLSYLCFRCSSRYFPSVSTSTWDISMSLTATAPTSRSKVIGLWVLKIVFALAFIAAGGAKIYGPPAMVAEFDAVGLGQWFRYFTAALEIIGAILLLTPHAT